MRWETEQCAIDYVDNLNDISLADLSGFFVGWPKQPSPEKLFLILQNSEYIILALDREKKKVVGFINAISDKILSAYIPLLEVLPDYQHKGIGSALVSKMLEKLESLYMIDAICDAEVVPFYEKLGMKMTQGMSIRNFERQGAG